MKPIIRSHTSAPPVALQQAIAEQTAAFLASGGKIQQIPNGVSGHSQLGSPQQSRQPSGPKKH
jgi:hypothetical protein